MEPILNSILNYKDPDEISILDDIIAKTVTPEKPKPDSKYIGIIEYSNYLKKDSRPWQQEYMGYYPKPREPEVDYEIAKLKAELKFAEDYIHANEPKSYAKPIYNRPQIRYFNPNEDMIMPSKIEVEYVSKYDMLKAQQAYATTGKRHYNGTTCSVGCKCVPCTGGNCDQHRGR